MYFVCVWVFPFKWPISVTYGYKASLWAFVCSENGDFDAGSHTTVASRFTAWRTANRVPARVFSDLST